MCLDEGKEKGRMPESNMCVEKELFKHEAWRCVCGPKQRRALLASGTNKKVRVCVCKFIGE